MKASELATRLGARFVPAATGDLEISGLAPLDAAGPSQVTFLTNPKYEQYLPQSKAGAVIIAKEVPGLAMAQVVHDNPHYAFARTAQMFVSPHSDFDGISDRAFVAATAKIGKNVTIYPFAYVGSNVEIGDGVTIYPNAYVGSGSVIGSGTVIHPNAVISHGSKIGQRVIIHAGAVIGSDGFGFAPGKDDIAKVPQVGIVVIEDDVEVGSLSNIDRGAIIETRIKKGTKLDSLVHIAHNVVIGENSMLCGQSGVAGSAKIGNWVIVAGQAAVNGHTKVGDHIHLGARGVIESDLLSPPGNYHGFPAKPSKIYWREQLAMGRLPDLIKEVRKLREEVKQMAEKK